MASQKETVVFQPYIFRWDLLVSGKEDIPHRTFSSHHHEIHHPYHISPRALATGPAVEAWQIHQRQVQATQSLAGIMGYLKINPFMKENIWIKPPCRWVPCKFSKANPLSWFVCLKKRSNHDLAPHLLLKECSFQLRVNRNPHQAIIYIMRINGFAAKFLMLPLRTLPPRIIVQ